MKRYNGEDGSQVDEMEAANKNTEGMLSNPNAKEFGDAGTSETVKATPKAMPKATPKAAAKPAAKAESAPAPKAAPVDETKLSLTDRMKLSRDRAKAGSTTDTRSVSQRLRAAFGMKKGGATKKMASGGMTSSSASKRADGIAVKGKTRGKMC